MPALAPIQTPQEHVKPLRALLKAAGYRPAPLATIGVVSVDIPLTINGQHISPEPAGSGMASAAGNTAADCGYPSFVLSGDTDVEVPAAVSNIASDGSYGAAAPGYTALISSLGAAAAAAGGPAPATDAATGQPAALDPYPPLGHLLGVRDFVHLASGRKVQLIACREPRVSRTVGVPATHMHTLAGLHRDSWWKLAARQAGTGAHLLTAPTLCSPALRRRRLRPLASDQSTCVPPLKQPQPALTTPMCQQLPAQDAPSHFDLSAAATLFDGSQLRTLYPATTDK